MTQSPIDFSKPAPHVASQLLGHELVSRQDGKTVGGIIIETEAYNAQDPASHSFRGPNQRNRAMWGPNKHIYIYKIYGLHHCMNFVCGNHDGQGVLLRALFPTKGLDIMAKRRGRTQPYELCSGPAKLFVALGLQPSHNAQSLSQAGLSLIPPKRPPIVTASKRIGITKGVDTPWRFTCDPATLTL